MTGTFEDCFKRLSSKTVIFMSSQLGLHVSPDNLNGRATLGPLQRPVFSIGRVFRRPFRNGELQANGQKGSFISQFKDMVAQDRNDFKVGGLPINV